MPSDADLVRRARGGDRDAFAALVERHHATLVRCCRRMVGETAPDAAQDAVITAMLSLDRLREDDRFGAWLVGILMLEGGGRELKIWVGPAEVLAVAALLEEVELPRPGTHHLTASLLAATGASVREVRVTRLAEQTFYGEVVLADGTPVDARPSDVITLGLVTGAPLLVDAAVLEQTATPDPEWEPEVAAADAATDDRRVLADEVRERISRRS